jgi:hypothetical protein
LQIQNRLLVSLKPEDLELLAQHLSEIRIQQGELLEEPDRPLEAVYFPQSGMISLVVQMPEDIALEVGTVGAEGAIGMAVGLGSRRSFICALVQVSGTCLRISASRFQAVANLSSGIASLSPDMRNFSSVKFNRLRHVMPCTPSRSDCPVGFCKRVTRPGATQFHSLMSS